MNPTSSERKLKQIKMELIASLSSLGIESKTHQIKTTNVIFHGGDRGFLAINIELQRFARICLGQFDIRRYR